MPRAATLALLERYYAAFNAGNWDSMLECLSDDVAHDLNQGARQVGKAQFTAFMTPSPSFSAVASTSASFRRMTSASLAVGGRSRSRQHT